MKTILEKRKLKEYRIYVTYAFIISSRWREQLAYLSLHCIQTHGYIISTLMEPKYKEIQNAWIIKEKNNKWARH